MRAIPDFDLQSHSVHSDGALAPAEVVARAAAAGVKTLALTDHDTVDGVGEALEAASEHGVALVPATELSVVDPAAQDIHVLGYGVDHADPAFLAALERFRGDREARAGRMVENLRGAGLAVDTAQIDARRTRGEPIGRPHLAEGVLAHPANAQRLADEQIADVGALIVAYLIEGRPGFSGRTTPTVPEALQAIHAAGGVAVWAHPFWDVEDPGDVLATLDRYAALGLDGVEAFYVTHDEAQTRLLHDAAVTRGLRITGSSDFHGPEHKLFSRFAACSTYGLQPDLRDIA